MPSIVQKEGILLGPIFGVFLSLSFAPAVNNKTVIVIT